MCSAIRRDGSVVVVVRRAEAGAPQSSNAVERIGYTRVSTVAQTLEQQKVAISAAGVTKIVSDVMSGARDDRPGLAELLAYVRPGDSVIV
jgi:predicted site-specific integrase-resolvase